MRSIWKGHIRFSLVTIPVRIYNALETAETIRFNQLHKECNGPIGYDKKCKKCKETVTTENIVKGYQYEPDQYVIIEPGDLEKIRLKSTKVIEIEGFVKASDIHPTLYEAPYYAGPDGEVAMKAYTLLHKALKESGRVGVGKVILRDREDVVVIGPHEHGIVLYRLRYPIEIRKVKDVPQLDANGLPEVSREQLKLAHTLIDTMSTSLADIDLTDKYHEALKEIITAKIEGKEIVTSAVEERPVVDIMTALKQSIEQSKDLRKPMVKATGKAKKEEPVTIEKKQARSRKRS